MTTETTGSLYSFIEADERDAPALVATMASSVRDKMVESAALRRSVAERLGPVVDRAGQDLAERFARGGRLLAMGNGGSATDAEGLVDLFTRPPQGQPLPALSLAAEVAVVTALANDVGVESVFSRQVLAQARPEDCVVGFSTSGDSPNLLRAFEEARRRGLLTIGFSGYDGGAMEASGTLDYSLVVPSASVHRIQESQATLAYELWDAVQRWIDDDGDEGSGA
jgi:D-sedoheptulose 7-phosphate isomerase